MEVRVETDGAVIRAASDPDRVFVKPPDLDSDGEFSAFTRELREALDIIDQYRQGD